MNMLILATKRFIRDEDGVTAIEYGLIAALIAIVIIGAVSAAGVSLEAMFQKVANCLDDAAAGTACA